jgi:hypothetical protein
MQSWPATAVPALPATPDRRPVRVHDSSSGGPVEVGGTDGRARLYVCGITPYDATHLGHAATYLAFDTLVRTWLDAGLAVDYAQNVTDIDDPLLERAQRDGTDWREVAARETQLFREDMTALRVLPPAHYVGAVEAMDVISAAVARLRDAGLDVTAVIADSDPIVAVSEAFDPRRHDEIIVGTLPVGDSRWLRIDLPHRVARMTSAPVTHVTATPRSTTPPPAPPKHQPGLLGPLEVLSWSGGRRRD